MKINEARSELNLIPKNHYMYNFDYFYWYPSHNYENEFSDGATHTAELPFIFGTDLEEATQEDLLMSKFMMTYWTNFAKNGNVNNDLVPTLWTPMEGKDSDEELTMWFRGGQDFHGNHYPNGYVNSCQMDNIDNKNHVKFIETFYQSKFN
jgi:carboxylesterase type B